MMQLHLVPSPSGTSSTRTRCETLAIIPRISGLSSLTTESRRRCRPSRLTVAFAGVYVALVSVLYVVELAVVEPLIVSGHADRAGLLTIDHGGTLNVSDPFEISKNCLEPALRLRINHVRVIVDVAGGCW